MELSEPRDKRVSHSAAGARAVDYCEGCMIMTPAEIRAARTPLVEAVQSKRIDAERQIKEILRKLEADVDTSVESLEFNSIRVHLLAKNAPVTTVDSVHITLRAVV